MHHPFFFFFFLKGIYLWKITRMQLNKLGFAMQKEKYLWVLLLVCQIWWFETPNYPKFCIVSACGIPGQDFTLFFPSNFLSQCFRYPQFWIIFVCQTERGKLSLSADNGPLCNRGSFVLAWNAYDFLFRKNPMFQFLRYFFLKYEADYDDTQLCSSQSLKLQEWFSCALQYFIFFPQVCSHVEMVRTLFRWGMKCLVWRMRLNTYKLLLLSTFPSVL